MKYLKKINLLFGVVVLFATVTAQADNTKDCVGNSCAMAGAMTCKAIMCPMRTVGAGVDCVLGTNGCLAAVANCALCPVVLASVAVAGAVAGPCLATGYAMGAFSDDAPAREVMRDLRVSGAREKRAAPIVISAPQISLTTLKNSSSAK